MHPCAPFTLSNPYAPFGLSLSKAKRGWVRLNVD